MRGITWTARRRESRSGPSPWLLAVSLLVALSVLLPLVYLVIRAAGSGPDLWRLLFSRRTFDILVSTVALAAGVTLASILISVPLAWLTARTDLPFRRAWGVLFTMPLAVPSYVGGFIVVAALGPRGMLQSALEPLFGVERLPEIYGFPGAWLALTLFSYPYVFLSTRAALAGMDPALEEAARGLGRGPWTTFMRVILPQLRPAIAVGGLLVALYTLSDFGAVSLLQFNTFTRGIYVQYQASFDRALAAGLALGLVALTLLIVLLEGWSRGRATYYRASTGAARQPRLISLGRWRGPSMLFCALIATLAVVLPTLVLLYWLFRGLLKHGALQSLPGLAFSSLGVSVLAALVAVVLAIPVALYSVRFPSLTGRLLERGVYLGYALPGIVVALSLVFLGANYAPLLYQTLAMLIFAYVVRFIPQAFGNVRSSLLQVKPSLEEAARGLGRSRAGVFFSVTLPLIRPGLLAGLILVFITTMKELPATLLLGPTGFKTLATAIWSSTSEGFFAEAALPIFLLLLISALPTLTLGLRESPGVT